VVAAGYRSLGAGRIGERRRIAEDQVVLTAVVFEPGHRVGLDQAMCRSLLPIQGQVLRRPVEVGRGQVHARGLRRARRRGVHAGHAGVAEQVEETLAARLGADAQAQRPMVEEQSVSR
jgi:hypothetical protein